MKSEAFGRICAGPVGSGKTTACVMEVLRRCMQQAKAFWRTAPLSPTR
jgi:hypothetical protein